MKTLNLTAEDIKLFSLLMGTYITVMGTGFLIIVSNI